MEQFLGNVSGPIINAVSMLFILILGIGVKRLSTYIDSRDINESLKADMLKTLNVGAASARAVIAELSTDTKQALADGTLSKEEMAEIQSKAVAKVKEQVPDLEERLNTHITNGSQYLADVIMGEFEKANKVTGIQ